MRIALTNPTYWPEVRRGTERVMHDLGTGLLERGHEVTILTSHPHRPRTTIEDGLRVIRAWRPPRVRPLRNYEDFVQTAPAMFAYLLRGPYDVAQTFFPVDGWAAAKARRFGGPPYVFTLHGAPTRAHLVAKRYRIEIMQGAVGGAAQVTVLSDYMADFVRRYLQVDPLILPAGIALERFAANGARAERPTLLCPADLSDPRKRGPLLLEGFARLREQRPDARLVIALGGDGVEAPEGPGIVAVRCDSTEALARAYSEAWATVLTSFEEAFGLITVESLATGTPVVAARSGHPPEILDDPRLGALFEGEDPTAVAAAMARALDVSQSEGTAAACRERARAFSWERLLDSYERTLEAAAAGSSPSWIEAES